jgi:hypothetical protein
MKAVEILRRDCYSRLAFLVMPHGGCSTCRSTIICHVSTLKEIAALDVANLLAYSFNFYASKTKVRVIVSTIGAIGMKLRSSPRPT